MAGIDKRNFDSPDETRPFQGKGKVEIINVGGRTVGRSTFEPGWRWSVNVKPIAGTDSCQASHLGYIVSGRLRITMNDGTQGEAGPGDIFVVEPGHDGEVVGDEPCIALDFDGAVARYAR